MNLITYAVPFFALAIVAELSYGLLSQRNTYRLNDSISSLFLGILSQARRFLTVGVGGWIYHLVTQYFSLPLMDVGHWFTWVLAFVVYDLCYYWLHRLGHERSILWAAHVAHHQSEDYNLTTALRQTSTGFLLSWVFYVPMYVLGMPAEVVVTVGALNLIYQFWVHTEHVPKLGWYEKVFVTPSNHRVHHAQNDLYLDRNYGGVFILWDRLFGTFQEERSEAPCVYGIRGPLRSWNPARAITHLYLDMFRDSWSTASLKDKFRVWYGRTGWRPEDVSRRFPKQKNDLDTFEKYDPKTGTAVGLYCVVQLVAMIVLLNYMQTETLTQMAGVILCVLMCGTTVTTALWLELRGSDALLKWELLRLSGLFAVIIAGYFSSFHASALVAGAIYGVVNISVLPWLRSQAMRVSKLQGVVP
jgi:sterol desaturase/sphingolipid hydroxylase (fatty acid hydroxylase superfamily)